MSTSRIEAFSDAVIAIIMTIMVLELTIPHEPSLAALAPLVPKIISYALSFVILGIYWNNHHHLLQAAKQVNGRVLWANLHLLFWLSLIPFTTGWVGENNFAKLPVALYGVVLLLSGFAYNLLSVSLIKLHGKDSVLARAVGQNVKGLASLGIYSAAVPLAFLNAWIAFGLYVLVAILWFVPDRRIERTISK
jgi:uncharacterized membrane protein